jgi:hypothetical protein
MTIEMIASALPCLDFLEPTKESVASDWLNDLRGPRAPRWIWVVPSARRKRALLRNWPSTSKGESAILPRIVTLEGLTNLVAAHIGTKGKRISSLERRLRVLRAWQTVNPDLSAGLGAATQVDQLLRSYQESQATPIEPTDKAFLLTYQQQLEEDHCLDRNSLWLAVTQELQAVPPTVWNRFPFEGIVLDGFHRFGNPEAGFLVALGKRMPVRLWTPCIHDGQAGELLNRLCAALGGITPHMVEDPAPRPLVRWAKAMLGHESLGDFPSSPVDDSLTRLDLEDHGAEALELVRRIRTRLLEFDAPKPHEIAVILPGPEYDSALRQGFLDAGITFNIAGQSRVLAQSAPARLVHAALHLVKGGDSLRSLMDFLRLPIVKDQFLGEACTQLAWLEEALSNQPQPESFADWPNLMEKLRARLDQEKEASAFDDEEGGIIQDDPEEEEQGEDLPRKNPLEVRSDLLDRALQVLALLEPLSRAHETIESCLDGIGQLLSQLKVLAWISPGNEKFTSIDPAVWSDEQLAWEKLKSVLNLLRGISDDVLPHNRLGLKDPLHVVLMALESESYQIKTEDDEGVQILEIRETRGLRFREIHVLGLKSGAYDAQSEEEILRRLLAEQRQTRGYELQESRQIFFQLGMAASDRLTLYRPCFADEEALLPSVWLEGIAASPPSSVRPIIGERSLQIAMGLAAPLEGIVPLRCGSDADPGAKKVARQTSLMRDQSKAWWEQLKSPAIDPWALPFIPELADTSKAFSPSRIETYSRCPFRYFTQSTLGMHERDSDETALLRGTLIHELFHRFIDHCREARNLDKGQPMSLGLARSESRKKLLELWHQLLAEFPERAAQIDERVRAIVTETGGPIDLYLDNLERLDKESICHIASEHTIGPQAISPVGDPVFIRGRIDDWFQRPDGRAVFVDYKAGTVPGQKDFFEEHAQNLRIQLDLYAAALNMTVAQGLYLFLQINKPHQESDHLKNLTRLQGEMVKDWAGLPRGAKAPAPIDAAKARDHALVVANEIRKGAFPLTSINDGEECARACIGKTICRTPYPTMRRF